MKGDERAQVVLTPIATPLPLTSLGLVAATTILAGLELHWVPAGRPASASADGLDLRLHGRSATAATGSSVLAAAWLGIALALINAPQVRSRFCRRSSGTNPHRR